MFAFYKDWIVSELSDWADTFIDTVSDEDEEIYPFDLIHQLIDRFEKNNYSKEDLENILFHLWQKNDFTNEIE